jgi:hypothetical protein
MAGALNWLLLLQRLQLVLPLLVLWKLNETRAACQAALALLVPAATVMAIVTG